MTKILIIVAGVLGAGLAGTLLIWIPNLYESRATERAGRLAAVAANKTNLATIDRLESDVVIAQAIAIADAAERRKLETETDDLKQAAADAPDGDCSGLRALIERRRLQRQ